MYVEIYRCSRGGTKRFRKLLEIFARELVEPRGGKKFTFLACGDDNAVICLAAKRKPCR